MANPTKDHFIKIDKCEKEFNEFLRLPLNERIIFSGMFGSGKTYFLNSFFKDHPEYIAFHLYPTNYSVSKNEDIFELIKYDLLYEILKYSPLLDKIKPTFFETVSFLSFTEPERIVEPFIQHIPVVGKSISAITTPLIQFVKLFEDLHAKFKEKEKELTIDDAKSIANYIKKFHDGTGRIYEHDVYTELINKLITDLKQDDKKVILIIDDLDRIDPDHIFRILNVFAVHFNAFNVSESENKFCVDNIILSCDIENVRSIFSARYGQSVDFTGYIDKFFTREIFHFDNKASVITSLEEIFRSIKTGTDIGDLNPFKSNEKVAFNFIKFIIVSMLQSNTINLRTLLRLNGYTIYLRRYKFFFLEETIENIQFMPFLVFDFLTLLFGSDANVAKNLERTEFALVNQPSLAIFRKTFERVLAELKMLLSYRAHNFAVGQFFSMENDGARVNYMVEYDHGYFLFYAKRGHTEMQKLSYSPEVFKTTLIDAFTLYSKLKTGSIN